MNHPRESTSTISPFDLHFGFGALRRVLDHWFPERAAQPRDHLGHG